MDLATSCETCSVCWTGTSPNYPRIFKIESQPDVINPPILIIDDMAHSSVAGSWNKEKKSYASYWWDCHDLTRSNLESLTAGLPFTYTQAVRCDDWRGGESSGDLIEACGVWTHNLAADRKLIITGKFGFRQLGLPIKNFTVHKIYRSARLGLIFTILPSNRFPDDPAEYSVPISRVLKEANLL